MDWREMMKSVLGDPVAHFWVKEILNQALQKDPVDAYLDIVLVALILKARMDESVGMED
jgi:hypothetical protein